MRIWGMVMVRFIGERGLYLRGTGNTIRNRVGVLWLGEKVLGSKPKLNHIFNIKMEYNNE